MTVDIQEQRRRTAEVVNGHRPAKIGHEVQETRVRKDPYLAEVDVTARRVGGIDQCRRDSLPVAEVSVDDDPSGGREKEWNRRSGDEKTDSHRCGGPSIRDPNSEDYPRTPSGPQPRASYCAMPISTMN